MEMRKLGYTDLHLTIFGLGSWAAGGSWQFGWGSQDDAHSIEILRRGLELGANWIDTAAVYGLGHSEEVVAKIIADWPEPVIVATKCGQIWWEKEGEITANLKPATIRREIEDSLRRLNVEVIDLLHFHWPDPDTPVEESWQTLADIIKEGKVRYAGLSNFEPDLIARCQAIHPVASVQPPYSMIVRDVEDGLLDYCGQNDIGVVCYSPLGSGLLTGAFNYDALAKDDWRRRNPYFLEPLRSMHLELVAGLRAIAEQNNRTVAELALVWVLSHPEVTSAIVGAQKTEHIEASLKAHDWKLSDADLAEVNALLAKHDAEVKIAGGNLGWLKATPPPS